MLAENLQQVNANIEKACAAVSRDPGEVTLVAVSKTCLLYTSRCV